MKKQKMNTEIKDQSSSISNVDDQKNVVSDEKVQKPIQKPDKIEYKDPLLKSIDDARLVFYKYYKITNIIKWIVTFFILGSIIAAYFILSNIENGITWILVTTAVALALLAVYTILMNQLKKKRMDIYFTEFYNNSTKFVFDESHYSDVVNDPKEKIDSLDFIASNIYKDIISVPSRNVIRFTFNNSQMMICDCAGQVKTKKRIAPVFVGKMLISPNDYSDDNGIIIYYTCKKELALPPTNLDGVQKVFEDKKIQIFTNNDKYAKTLSKAVRDSMNKISMDDVLIDMTISIQKGKTFVAMGYDDSLMIIPFENQFKPNPLISFKNQMVCVAEIVSLLSPKGRGKNVEK